MLVGATLGAEAELREANALIESLLWRGMTREVSGTAGRLQAHLLDDGRPLAITDCLVAAATMVHGGTLVTRDQDFAELDSVDLLEY